MSQFLVAIHLPDDFDPSSTDKSMAHDIDVLNYPVLLGTGKRFFAEASLACPKLWLKESWCRLPGLLWVLFVTRGSDDARHNHSY